MEFFIIAFLNLGIYTSIMTYQWLVFFLPNQSHVTQPIRPLSLDADGSLHLE
jgi:hypothetical protein